MGFETFKRQRLRPGHEPFLTIQRKGVLSLNRPAYDALGEPQAVELLFDREANLIGVRATDESVDHAYNVRSVGKGGTYLVSGTAFTNYYGIDTSKPIRRAAQVDNDVLIVDLNDPGTEVTSNRSRHTRQGTLQVP